MVVVVCFLVYIETDTADAPTCCYCWVLCLCRHVADIVDMFTYVLSTLLVCCYALAMWRVLCFYMSAAKHFGFVRSCLAAVFGYFLFC